MVSELEDAMRTPPLHCFSDGGLSVMRGPSKHPASDNAQLDIDIDTCIVDEAGCVLESSIPVVLRWRPANLVVVSAFLSYK